MGHKLADITLLESILPRLHIQDQVYLLAWHDPNRAIQFAIEQHGTMAGGSSTLNRNLPSFRKTIGFNISSSSSKSLPVSGYITNGWYSIHDILYNKLNSDTP